MVILFGIFLFTFQGCSQKGALSKGEKEKLDIQLQRLFTEEPIPENLYNISVDDSGIKRYGVLIYISNGEALKKSGIPINSVNGNIATVNLTLDQLRAAAHISEVRAIKNISKSYPQ